MGGWVQLHIRSHFILFTVSANKKGSGSKLTLITYAAEIVTLFPNSAFLKVSLLFLNHQIKNDDTLALYCFVF